MRCSEVSAEIGTVGVAGDITEVATVKAVAELARSSYGEVDIWFSNAGYAGPRQPGQLQDDAVWELSWQLHVMAHLRAAREVLPAMLDRGDGYLIQTASVVALATQPDKAAYSVTSTPRWHWPSGWPRRTARRASRVSCFARDRC